MQTWWREIGELDEDQREVIGLPADGSYLVKGPPGSGKTNLLVLRANYLAASEQPNLAVVVFTQTLREFIRAGADRYEFDAKNVVTSRLLLNRLLEEAGQPFQGMDDFDKDRRGRLAAAGALFGPGRAPVYDVLLLDEAQDFLPGEIRLFRRLARDLFMVADSRQQIYGGGSKLTDLRGAVDRMVELRHHYRSGQPICEVADGIGRTFSAGYDPVLPTCNYRSASFRPSVDVVRAPLVEQARQIAERLQLQRRAYPDELLGVICPRGEDRQFLAQALKDAGLSSELCIQGDEGSRRITGDKPIWISTVHAAKGLEFRALHFAAAETVASFRAEQKRLAYTGVTRAKTSLVVYHDGGLPAYFDAALNVARITPARRPPLETAFGKR